MRKYQVGRTLLLNTQNNTNKGKKPEHRSSNRHIFELVLFSMLGALMFCSRIIMQALPNIHLVGMFTVTLTLVFRAKALIPIYISVLLSAIYYSFSPWMIQDVYIWAVLWAIAMPIPKKAPRWILSVVCPVICSLHGFLFGILSAPAHALVFDLGFEEMIAWIVSGAIFDVAHGIGNLFAGLFIIPLSELIKKLLRGNFV